MVLDMHRLGMSLARMNKQSDAVRFLDDVDIKLTSESRSEWNRLFTGMSIAMEQELVFRVSYRDILLIQTIFNRAATLFLGAETKEPQSAKQAAFDNAANAAVSRAKDDGRNSYTVSSRSQPRAKSNLGAKVIVTTEEVMFSSRRRLEILTMAPVGSCSPRLPISSNWRFARGSRVSAHGQAIFGISD